MAIKRPHRRKILCCRWYWISTTISTLHIIISTRSSSSNTSSIITGHIAVMAAFHHPIVFPSWQTRSSLDNSSSSSFSRVLPTSSSSSSSYSSSFQSISSSCLLQAMSSEDIKAQHENTSDRKIPPRRSSSGASSSSPLKPHAGDTIHSGSGHDDDGDENLSSPLASSSSSSSSPSRNPLHDEVDDELPLLSSKGMARLSRAVAKASAEREALKISTNGNRNTSYNSARSSSSSTRVSMNNIYSTTNNNNGNSRPGYTNGKFDYGTSLNNGKIKSTTTAEPKSLSQLTRVIDSQLYANGPRGARRGDYPKIDGVVQNARDHMISLLGFNQVQGDWKRHSSTSTYNVAIVFGKELVRDQVTVEYASRIRTLARLFKEEPEFRPKLVCFCGGIAEGSHVANSDAGYIFFRHMCEAQGIDLDGVSIYIDNSSESDSEAVRRVTEEVKKKYIPKWLEDSPEMTDLMQKMIDVHFTLVSTEYHLCNMNDVHHRSPEQSLLREMENMGREFLDRPRMSFDQTSSVRGNDDAAVSGLVKTSWSFQYATYPYIYAKNDLVAFLGKCYLLAEELVPLLVNMKAVVEQKEFFQRDNYLILASIRRSLVEEIEALHKPSLSRKKTLNTELRRLKDMYGNERDVITILEGALSSLGRCVDLVKPAGLHTGSVSKDDWRKALKSLEHSMNEIRSYCDPDRPLMPSEWGKLVDDDSTTSKRSY
eukprot:CAMPEP_0176499180 /NCGR_PEP_ID=MMETSP0200_2-20121128/12769_1 /TAXON_ID=947934 /ORGANISM="Chaetoceros sp., Strain GSL56" /LENGTH=708 /DNA_ID=CAMNT_0017897541 /DNA_START=30 /DNA_END=2156 /DNA_ORIENTATION=-